MQIINANNAVILAAAVACLPALTAAAPVAHNGALAERSFEATELEARAGSFEDSVDFADDDLFEMNDLEARDAAGDAPLTLAEDKAAAKAFIKLNSRDLDVNTVLPGASKLAKQIFREILKLSTKDAIKFAKQLNVPGIADVLTAASNAVDQTLARRDPEPIIPLLAAGMPLFKVLLGGAIKVGVKSAVKEGANHALQQRSDDSFHAISADDSFDLADEDLFVGELVTRDVGVNLEQLAKGASGPILKILKMMAKLTQSEAISLGKQLNIPGITDLLAKVQISDRSVEARSLEARNDVVDRVIAAAPAEIKDLLRAAANLSLDEAKELAHKLNLSGIADALDGIHARDARRGGGGVRPKPKVTKPTHEKPNNVKPNDVKPSPTASAVAPPPPPPSPAPVQPVPVAPSPVAAPIPPAQRPVDSFSQTGADIEQGINTVTGITDAFGNLTGSLVGVAAQGLTSVIGGVFGGLF